MNATTTTPSRRSAAVHRSKTELRVLGTTVTLQEHIREQAERDLGIRLRYIVDDGFAVQRAGVMHPETYEVYDQWFHSIDCLWPARALQPIDVSRITRWNEIQSLARSGELGGHKSEEHTSELQSQSR